MQPVQIPTVQVGLEASIQKALQSAGKGAQINLGTTSKQINALAQPLGRITGQADEFTKSMNAANARVLAFGASVGIINAVSNAFSALIKNTIEVEKSLAEINTVLNTSQDGLQKFGDRLFQVAKNTGQSFDVVAKGALELARQGLNTEETLKRINDALILTRLSGLDSAQSVEGLTAAFNSFKDTGLTVSEILNKLVVVSQKYAVSERDLIEGLKRSASVADQAGVSFDELVGIITSVQERTARGGAVIGNAFKTIFTRVQRTDSLQALQDIGIAVTDIEGKILPATKLLENLAQRIEGLNQIELAEITEKIGGGFQIANLIAALKDLSKEQSVFAGAVQASLGASNEAYAKNAALNETLASLINKVNVSAQQLGATLGKIGITDSLKGILSFFNNLLEGIQKILQEDSALGKVFEGLVKGIGNVIAGPGLALFAAIIAKLSKDLVQFGFQSLKSFLGIGEAAKGVKAVQDSINAALAKNSQLQQQLFQLEGNRAAQLALITKALVEQEAVIRRSAAISQTLAAPLYGAGVRSTSQGLRVPPKAAGGYMPAVAGEASDIRRGVGGARSSDRPVIIPNFAFGGGKRGPIVANTSEYIVPNFAGGSGSAIFNRDMIRSMGLPSGAEKINAAGGFIPNFVKPAELIKSTGAKSIQDIEKYRIPGSKSFQIGEGKEGRIAESQVNRYFTSAKSTSQKQAKTINIAAALQSKLPTILVPQNSGSRVQNYTSSIDELLGIKGSGAQGAFNFLVKGTSGNIREFFDQSFTPQAAEKLAKNQALKLARKIAAAIAEPDPLASQIESQVEKGTLPSGFITAVKGAFGGIFDAAMSSLLPSIAKSNTNQGDFDVRNGNSSANFQILEKLFGGMPVPTKGQFAGLGDFKFSSGEDAVRSMVGKVKKEIGSNPSAKKKLLTAYQRSTGKLRAAEGFIPNFASPNAIAAMKRLLVDPAASAGEKANARAFLAKAGMGGMTSGKGVSLRYMFDRDGLIGSKGLTDMVNYAYRQSSPTASSEQVYKVFERLARPNLANLRNVAKQKGFVPNFADPLSDAIGREMAAGVPASQIYVDQNSSLKNSMNPMGLMVANRRDEPGGAMQGVARAKREGANPMFYGAAGGYVPNYAAGSSDPNLEKGKRDILGTIFAVQAGLSLLTGATEGSANGIVKFGNAISNVASTATTALFVGEGLKGLAKEGSTASKVLGKFGIYGAIAAGAFEAFGQITKYLDSTNSSIIKAGEAMDRVSNAASRAAVNLQSLSPAQRIRIEQSGEGLLKGAKIVRRKIENVNRPGTFRTEKREADFEGVSSELENAFQNTINQGLAVGVSYDKMWNMIQEAAKSGGKITADEVNKISQEIEGLIQTAAKVKPQDLIFKFGLKPEEGFGEKLTGATPQQIEGLLKGDSTQIKQIREYLSGQGISNPTAQNEQIKRAIELLKEQSKTQEEVAEDAIKQASTSLKNTIKAIQKEKAERQLIAKLTDKQYANEYNASVQIASIRADLTLSETERSNRIAEIENGLENQNALLKDQVSLVEEINKLIGDANIFGNEQQKGTFEKLLKQEAQRISELTGGERETALEAVQNPEKVLQIFKNTDLNNNVEAANKFAEIILKIINFQDQLTESTGREADKRNANLRLTQAQNIVQEKNNQLLERAQNYVSAIADQYSLQASRLSNQSQILSAQREFAVAQYQAGTLETNPQKRREEERAIIDEFFKKSLDLEQKRATAEAQADFIRNLKVEENITKLIDNTKATIDNTDALLKFNMPSEFAAGEEAVPINLQNGLVDEATAAIRLGSQGIFQEVNDQANNCAKVIKVFANAIGISTDGVNDVANSFQNWGQTIEKSQIQPGDILINTRGGRPGQTGGHVGMYLGDGKVLQASQSAYDQIENTKQQRAAVTPYDANDWNMIRRGSIGMASTGVTSRQAIDTTISVGMGGIAKARELASLEDTTKILENARAYTSELGLSEQAAEATAVQIKDLAIKMKQIGEDRALQETLNDLSNRTKDLENAPKNFDKGIADGVEELNRANENFSYNLAKEIPQMFSDNMSQAIQDIVSGTKDVEDAFKSVALSFVTELNKKLISNLTDTLTSSLFKPSGGSSGGGGIGSIISSIFSFSSGGRVKGGSGSKDDVPAMLMGGEYVINKKAVNKYGQNFLDSLNSGSLRGFQLGGFVYNPSSSKNDYEIIGQGPFGTGASAYAPDSLRQSGGGGYFTPGTYGQGEIRGRSELMSFATQAYTSGERDIIRNLDGFSSISLEPESIRLTNYGRRTNAQAEAIRSAKGQAFDAVIQDIANEEEAKEAAKAQSKALRTAAITTLITGLASAGIKAGMQGFQNTGTLGGIFTGSELKTIEGTGSGIFTGGIFNIGRGTAFNNQTGIIPRAIPVGRATGGIIPPTTGIDTVPAMLSGGEFVMNSAATQNIGTGNLQALNAGASDLPTEEKTEELNDKLLSKLDELIEATGAAAGNITINVDSTTGATQQQTSGEDGESRKALANQIKQAVLKVIQDEQRIGGSLRGKM